MFSFFTGATGINFGLQMTASKEKIIVVSILIIGDTFELLISENSEHLTVMCSTVSSCLIDIPLITILTTDRI